MEKRGRRCKKKRKPREKKQSESGQEIEQFNRDKLVICRGIAENLWKIVYQMVRSSERP